MVLQNKGAVEKISVLVLSLLAAATSQNSSQNDNGTESQTLPLLRSCKTPWRENDHQSKSLEKKGCYCDESCVRFGDCCSDFPSEKHQTTFVCLQTVRHGGIYFKKTCPSDWTNDEVRGKCEQTDKRERDMSLILPVISQTSNRTYINIYCAICNGEKDLVTLKTEMQIQIHHDHRQLSVFSREKSNVTTAENVYFKNKHIIIGVNPSIAVSTFRSCTPNLSYSSNVLNVPTQENYGAYKSTVGNKVKAFKNPKCKDCNKKLSQSVPFSPESRSVRNVRSTDKKVSQSKAYDVGKNSSSETSSSTFAPKKCEKNDTKLENCILIRREITIKNGDPPTKKYWQDFNTCTNYSCKEHNIPYSSLAKMLFFVPEQPFYERPDLKKLFPFYNGVFFHFIELPTSVSLLTLQLTTFFLSFKESTLFDKTIASLCFSELLSYILTIFHEVPSILKRWNIDIDAATCVPRSVLNQYCVLTTYSWILMISFQIWHTTRQACVKVRLINNDGHFVYYCVCGWVVPGVISLILPFLDYIPEGTALSCLRPALKDSHCSGIGDKAHVAMYLFIWLPAIVVLVLSLYFLYDTVRMIQANKFRKDGVKNLAENGIAMNFRFWFKLISLMALGWDLLCITVLHTILSVLIISIGDAVSKLVFLGGHVLFFILTVY